MERVNGEKKETCNAFRNKDFLKFVIKKKREKGVGPKERVENKRLPNCVLTRKKSSQINPSYLAYQGGPLAQTAGVPVQSWKAWNGQMWVCHAGGCFGAVEPAMMKRQFITTLP